MKKSWKNVEKCWKKFKLKKKVEKTKLEKKKSFLRKVENKKLKRNEN